MISYHHGIHSQAEYAARLTERSIARASTLASAGWSALVHDRHVRNERVLRTCRPRRVSNHGQHMTSPDTSQGYG